MDPKRAVALGGLMISVTLPAFLMAGCGSTPDKADRSESATSDLPDWVRNPQAEDGLATTTCVSPAGSFSRDQSRAHTRARQQLASQLSTQIESMAEQYQRTTETEEEGVDFGENFEQVTRSTVDEELRGSQAIRQEYVEMPQGKQFCTMMAMGQKNVNKILERASEAAGTEEPFTQAEMREQFMSQEALNRMDKQLEE